MEGLKAMRLGYIHQGVIVDSEEQGLKDLTGGSPTYEEWRDEKPGGY